MKRINQKCKLGGELYAEFTLGLLTFTLFACSIFYVISDTRIEEGTDETAVSSSGIAIYIDSGSGYELSSRTTFPTGFIYSLNTTKSSCTNGGTISQDSSTKTISVSVTSSDYCTLYYDKQDVTLSEYVISLADAETVPDFSTTATTDEGVFTLEDDYGAPSYYFRGAVENNYVYFAGYYWRIVRVNGDGTVRIIYDGKTSTYANGTSSTDRYISTSTFNDEYESSAYVGYMYGDPDASDYDELHANTNDSTIKTTLDTWYKNNLLNTEYESYLADSIFCNDRSVSYEGYLDSMDEDVTLYGAYERLDPEYANYTPQLTCNQQNDAFTVDDTTYGNGDLTYPIGLITADEMAIAGSSSRANNKSFYLYIGQYFWTMSPSYFNAGELYGDVWLMLSGGAIDSYFVEDSNGVRPVINLKADVLISDGDGTMDSPFEVTL